MRIINAAGAYYLGTCTLSVINGKAVTYIPDQEYQDGEIGLETWKGEARHSLTREGLCVDKAYKIDSLGP